MTQANVQSFAMTAGTELPPLTRVIHGTFAKDDTWWRPNGSDFTRGVAGVAHGFYEGSDLCSWSGRNSDADRRQAAADLVNWTNRNLDPGRRLWLLCHSHGGNVALLATQLGLKIDRLILMATPIRTDYTPVIRNINLLINLYVPWDYWQFAGTVEYPRETPLHCIHGYEAKVGPCLMPPT